VLEALLDELVPDVAPEPLVAAVVLVVPGSPSGTVEVGLADPFVAVLWALVVAADEQAARTKAVPATKTMARR
jgi:hypothetical protein